MLAETKEQTERDALTQTYNRRHFERVIASAAAKADMSVAENIRAQLEAKSWIVKGGPRMKQVTAPFGVAHLRRGESSAGLIRRADSKLYASKSAGRNKVVADEDRVGLA